MAENKNLIDFTEHILRRYNATPDEWDHFEDVKWSLNTTHKIDAVYYSKRNEVEIQITNLNNGKSFAAEFKVTASQGFDCAQTLMPCVHHDSCIGEVTSYEVS